MIASLLEIVHELDIQKSYRVQVIGEIFGHTVTFTPPYHPELNSIENGWGLGKGEVATRAPSSMDELKSYIELCFGVEGIKSNTWGTYC